MLMNKPELSFIAALKLVYDDWKEKGLCTASCMYTGHRGIAGNFVVCAIIFLDINDGEIIFRYPHREYPSRLDVEDIFQVKWRYHDNLFEVKSGLVND